MLDNFSRTITELTKIDVYGFAKRIQVSVQSLDPLHHPWIILDILISAVLIYCFLVFLKKIRLGNLLVGALVLIGLYLLAYFLDLALLLFIIKYFALFLVVVVPFFIVPKMRRALDDIEKEIRGAHIRELPKRERAWVIEEISRAIKIMAEKRVGSLIVLENKDLLNDLLPTGEKVEAKASSEFLTFIFFPGSKLRKGGAIIRGDEVVAANCILPKTKRKLYMDYISPRDLAAVGVSEQSDALSFVTSKNRGNISIAHEGSYITDIDPERVPVIIETILAGKKIKKQIDIK